VTAAVSRRIVTRGLLLLLTGVSLYLLFPSLLEVFTSWQRLTELDPAWVAGMLLFEAASFVAAWDLQRVALRTPSWFAVGTSQLAGNAFGRVVPGGIAAAAALQFRMLTRSGVPASTAASGLTAVSVLAFATVLALPLLALPALIGGAPVDDSLETSAYLGVAVFVLMALTGAVLFVWDRPIQVIGRAAEWVVRRIPRGKEKAKGLATRISRERDTLRSTLGASWKRALIASVGKWGFDYLALVAALYAVGEEANPSLVLLAYVAASILGMIPLTPGGLGFVEAGLTGTLALAGVPAADALLATLAYRLASFWLPIPAGVVGYWLFGRRYGAAPSEAPT
jgi:uncharacterized protein (TIRG00374 family)